MASTYTCFLHLFGFLFVLAASVVFVIGGYSLSLRHHLYILDAHKYGVVCGIILLLVGIVFIIFSLSVYREACKKSPPSICTLLSFFSISTTIVVALVATAGLTVVLPAKIDSSLKSNSFDIFIKYSTDERSTTDVDYLQKSFHCCGAHNFAIWFTTPYGKFPPSCCINETSCLNIKLITVEQVWSTGCTVRLHEFFYSRFIYMVVGAATLISIFLFCILVACILMKMKRSNN